jgi:hypothetical protein
VATGLEDGEGGRVVEKIWEADDDGVEVGIGEKILEGLVDGGRLAEFFDEGGAALGREIGDGVQLGVGGRGEGFTVHAAREAEADDADFERGVGHGRGEVSRKERGERKEIFFGGWLDPGQARAERLFFGFL